MDSNQNILCHEHSEINFEDFEEKFEPSNVNYTGKKIKTRSENIKSDLETWFINSDSNADKFLSKFFEAQKLVPEFCFVRDFIKCYPLPTQMFLAHAHILYRKYLDDNPLIRLDIEHTYKRHIYKKLWKNPDGTDPDSEVTIKLFYPVYIICFNRLNLKYLNFNLSGPMNDLFIHRKETRTKETRSNKIKRKLSLKRFNKSVKNWNMEAVGEWLIETGFGQYVDIFRQQGIDGNKLIGLTHLDFEKMGIIDGNLLIQINQL